MVSDNQELILMGAAGLGGAALICCAIVMCRRYIRGDADERKRKVDPRKLRARGGGARGGVMGQGVARGSAAPSWQGIGGGGPNGRGSCTGACPNAAALAAMRQSQAGGKGGGLANPMAGGGTFQDRWRDALRLKEEERLARERSEKMAAEGATRQDRVNGKRDLFAAKSKQASDASDVASGKGFVDKLKSKKNLLDAPDSKSRGGADQTKDKQTSLRVSGFFHSRAGKAAPPSVNLPKPGDNSRMSSGARGILDSIRDEKDEEVENSFRPTGPTPGSPEARTKRLESMQGHAACRHILQEDESGKLLDQTGEAPPWAGWATVTKSSPVKRAPDDWRGWGSQNVSDVREISLQRSVGSALDVMRTTQTVHI